MRRRLITPLALLALLASATAATAGDSSSPPARLGPVRICAFAQFDRTGKSCRQDQRGRSFLSDRVYCTVDVAVRRPGRLSAQLSYRGVPVYSYTTPRLSPGNYGWWIGDGDGPPPLPGGRWGCTWRFGPVHTGASFRSAGPAGPIGSTWVCAAADTVSVGSASVCTQDESSSPLSSSAVVCSAVFAARKGAEAEIALVSAGQVIDSTALLLGGPVWAASASFNPAPGSYTCRYSLGGATVAEQPFSRSG